MEWAALPGVVLGAIVIVALPEIFRDLQAYRLLVFGLMLMVLMIFRPPGTPGAAGTIERLNRRTAKADPGANPWTAEVVTGEES